MRNRPMLVAALLLSATSFVAVDTTASATASNALYSLVSSRATSVTWLAEPVTTKYDVYVNGTRVRTLEGAGNIHVTLGRALGPADKVEIATSEREGARVTAAYWADQWIYFPDQLIHFASGSNSLSADARKKIEAFAAMVELHGFGEVRAIGHDAGTAGAPGAYALGYARSAAVLKLLKRDLVGSNFTAVASSWGNAYPIASNASVTGRAENRRVELTLR